MTQRGPGRSLRVTATLLAAMLVVGGWAGTIRPAVAQDVGDGVAVVSGSYSLENPTALATTSQPYMLLLDMTAFVERDITLAPPLESQIIAPLVGDLTAGAEFDIPLPIQPLGTSNDVDGDFGDGAGVQIFSVEYSQNRQGDPFLGEREGSGWGVAQSSLETRPSDLEVIGGSLLVWAPDGEQGFPTGFGDDGLLFTEDDPIEAIEAGWTLVDMNEAEFSFVREAEVEVEIIRGDDGFTDYSTLGLVESFDALLEDLRTFYAFTEYRDIDFDALEAEYRPRVEEAETAGDTEAFLLALKEFSLEFNDGHTATAVPAQIAVSLGGHLGMRVLETDAGDVIVVGVAEGLPAAEAGIETGAVVTEWGGRPVLEAVEEVPIVNSESSEFRRRLQRFQFLTRSEVGDTVSVTFTNPGGEERTVELEFVEDETGASAALNLRVDQQLNDGDALPISTGLLPSGIGYIRVNTFLADPVEFTLSWDNAIRTLTAAGATGFIVDVRDNGGGYGDLPLYIASTFYDEPFTLATLYRPDFEGDFVTYGEADEVLPNGFNLTDVPVAVLTDKDCASACEIFAAAMAEDPEHLLVSRTPTAGIEAGIYLWLLPGGIPFQASYVYFERDGEIFVEGEGVYPNVEIPATPETLIVSEDDVELEYAVEAVLAQLAGEDPRNAEGGVIRPGDDGTPESEADEATPDAGDDEATPEAGATPEDEATPEA